MSAPKREGGVNETMHEKGGPEVPYNFSGRSIGPKRCLFEMGYLFRRRFMGRFWCSASFTKLLEMERLKYEILKQDTANKAYFKGDGLGHLPSPSYLAHLCTIGARGAPSASSKYIQLEAPGLGASFFILKFVYFSDIDTV